jgi:hypothetical protein
VPIVISSPDTVRSPVTTTSLLNVAFPAADISSDNALIALPPSLPLMITSLSDVVDLTTKSVDELVISPN